MPIDDYAFRPITFQGVTFPATLMAISVLEPALGLTDEDLGDWLWRLPICCGAPKRAPARRCARCARQAAEMLRAERPRVLAGIAQRLGPDGFDAETTFQDWLLALEQIAALSVAAGEGECVWSAPSHPRDRFPSAAYA